ncbi:hypothetical protein SAMN05192534_13113 [Alteribacillus persepolensis]|uniref:Uncharacterized protein n=1 Tax=Alteribacillus persepolensis TaxID=568899 RepID=A0A1G8JCY7_9BACI|nr:hypothetical protein SAMN05192534_13113 [Alteribacillus persepolensis]
MTLAHFLEGILEREEIEKLLTEPAFSFLLDEMEEEEHE